MAVLTWICYEVPKAAARVARRVISRPAAPTEKVDGVWRVIGTGQAVRTPRRVARVAAVAGAGTASVGGTTLVCYATGWPAGLFGQPEPAPRRPGEEPRAGWAYDPTGSPAFFAGPVYGQISGGPGQVPADRPVAYPGGEATGPQPPGETLVPTEPVPVSEPMAVGLFLFGLMALVCLRALANGGK